MLFNCFLFFVCGFYLKNGEGNVHYSNTKLNEKGDYYSAVKLYDNGHLYFGLEDWDNQYNNSDLDCNDIVFGITSVNLPTPVDPDEMPEETPKNEPEYNEFGTPVLGRIFCEDLGSTGDPVKVYTTTNADMFTEYELRNTVGGAPQKICVGKGTKWVIEYEDIVNAYPSFKSWVQDSKTANTFTDGVEKFLYQYSK